MNSLIKSKGAQCTLLLLLFCCLVQITLFAQTEDEITLRHIKEIDWPKAYREQDTALLDNILADEFKMIGSEGEYSNKKEQIQYIKTHKPEYISFKFDIKRLEVFENNTAIVSGTGTIHKKDDRGEYELIYQSSNVFIKRAGIWKAIASHTSGDKIIRKE